MTGEKLGKNLKYFGSMDGNVSHVARLPAEKEARKGETVRIKWILNIHFG